MGQWVSSNWTNADEYACSGTPYVTSSHAVVDLTTTTQKFTFPRVTRWIQVWNHNTTVAHAMKVGFTENGLKGTVGHMSGTTSDDASAHFVYIPGGSQGMTSTGRLEVRCTEVYVAATSGNRINFTLMAGLTNIPPQHMFKMTGSIDDADFGAVELIYGVG